MTLQEFNEVYRTGVLGSGRWQLCPLPDMVRVQLVEGDPEYQHGITCPVSAVAYELGHGWFSAGNFGAAALRMGLTSSLAVYLSQVADYGSSPRYVGPEVL